MKNCEPFKTVLSGDQAAIAKLSDKALFEIVLTTQSGMTVEAFAADVKAWLERTKDPCWSRPYTELVYQPMIEALQYLRANGDQTFFATGAGSFRAKVGGTTSTSVNVLLQKARCSGFSAMKPFSLGPAVRACTCSPSP